MNKLVTLSRLMCLTTALTAASALLATSDIANAKEFGQHRDGHVQQGSSHPANIVKRKGVRPDFVISGQPVNVKRVLRHHHHHKEKWHKADCKMNCYEPTRTTIKGNPTPTTAGNTAPTVNITPASAVLSDPKKGGDPPTLPLIIDNVKAQEVFFRTLGTVPAASVGAALIATSPAAAVAGTIENKNPITGPIKQSVETFGELATDIGNEISSWW
jgi:hypothetical protein